MKVHPVVFVGLIGLLFLSVVCNGVVLLRKPEAAPAPQSNPSRAAAARTAGESPEPIIAPSYPRTPDAALDHALAAEEKKASAPGVPAAAPVAAYSPLRDPKIAEVLKTQELFDAFWKDYDKMAKARDRIGEGKYQQIAVGSTMDFLELPEGMRAGFNEAAATAARDLLQARKDREAGRTALGPKVDKSNAAAYTQYQQQKDAIDDRYDQQRKSIVDGFARQQLDINKPRHAEFVPRLDKWLWSLAPKTTP